MFRPISSLRFVCLGLVFMLTACSKGIDKPLVTDKGLENFTVSLTAARKDMTSQDNDAFEWAVSNLSLADMNARYPNQSARQIVHGEARDVLTRLQPEIMTLEKELATWTREVGEINKVVATDVSFSLEKDFFGLQPRIKASILNGSKYSYSMLSWRAELYLNGATKPVAVSEQLDAYGSSGGLGSGARVRREMTVGFVSGDRTWSTLEIQNAAERRVKLTVVPTEAKDFGERHLVGASPAGRLDHLKDTLKIATKLKVY